MKDGLLYVDASGIIRLDNPAACLMRDAPLKDVPLETAFPCMKDSFSRAMRDCAEIQGEVRKVRGVSITFDCTPVAVNGIAAGGGAAGDEARHNGKDNANEDEPQRR